MTKPMTSTITALIAALTVTTASEAAAGQSTPASDFSGAYQVDCTRTAITLSAQLVAAEGTTIGVPEQRSISVSLPCATDEAALVDLAQRCRAAFEPDAVCDPAMALVRRAVAELTSRNSGILELAVGDNGTWWNRVAGLYNAVAELVSLEGDSTRTSLVITNLDGSNHGRFASVKLSATPVPWFGSVCAATQTSALTGRIDRADGFALTARRDTDLSMWCPTAGKGGASYTARIGLTLRTDIEGGPVILNHWERD